MSQIDGGKLVPLLTGKVLTSAQQAAIVAEPVRERRTAMLLDWLETKPADAYHAFVEAVGELYPHIYLELTGSGRDDDGTPRSAQQLKCLPVFILLALTLVGIPNPFPPLPPLASPLEVRSLPPLREVCPIAVRTSGVAHKLPSESWQSPAVKRILMHFGHKFALFDCSMTNNFLCLGPIVH